MANFKLFLLIAFVTFILVWNTSCARLNPYFDAIDSYIDARDSIIDNNKDGK